MFGAFLSALRRRRKSELTLHRALSQVQPLETRCLLSASPALSPDYIIQPDFHGLAGSGEGQQATYYTPTGGYTPSQISEAYGFNQISSNGAGTTIAVVDAYNDPNIASDLKTFDAKFGLPAPPSFKQISQTGGSTSSMATNAAWALETSLDVEWAHAIAPGANIVLVEANSDSLSDLLGAVTVARFDESVSVISMSWGGSEFAGEQDFSNDFTTPLGHIPETFVAASGDSGIWSGPQWPASSSNVLAVGGTTLYSLNSSGDYAAETGWADSTGGVSQFINEPAYQQNVQSTGGRTTSDVSYDANPNTGFAVYDSLSFDGVSGWQEIGGTSAGAPQWSALIALADQSRIASGLTTLDGVSEVLPTLYGAYSPPGSAGYASYETVFHDVGGDGGSFWLGGGAAPGYDLSTGLGSPDAPAVVKTLQDATATAKVSETIKIVSVSHWFADRFDAASADPSNAVVVQSLQGPQYSTPVLPAPANTGATLYSGAPLSAPAGAALAATASAGTGRYYDSAIWKTSIAASSADIAAATSSATSSAISEMKSVAGKVAHAARLVSVQVAETVSGMAAAPSEIAVETHVLLQLANLDASVFADSLRAFAHESAVLRNSTPSGGFSRTLAVTASAIMADTILVGYWYFARTRKKARAAEAEAPISIAR